MHLGTWQMRSRKQRKAISVAAYQPSRVVQHEKGESLLEGNNISPKSTTWRHKSEPLGYGQASCVLYAPSVYACSPTDLDEVHAFTQESQAYGQEAFIDRQ